MTQREKILSGLRAYFSRERMPRLVIAVILLVTAGSGFLCSRSLMIWGMQSLALRYFIATLVAWAAFIGLVRLWIEVERRAFKSPDDIALAARRQSLEEDDNAVLEKSAELAGNVLDLGSAAAEDGIGCLLPIIAFALLFLLAGIVLGTFALVAGAPALLAEVFLDVVVAAFLTRGLRAHDSQWWALGLLRRTWKLALALVCTLTVFGWAVQQWRPAIRSIGDLFR